MSRSRTTLAIVGMAALGAVAVACVDDLWAREGSEKPATPMAEADLGQADAVGVVSSSSRTAVAADVEDRSEAAETEEDAPPSEPDEAEPEEDDDAVWVGPPEHIEQCEEKLDEAGITWSASRIPLHETKGGITCGAEQIVRYHQGPGGISWGGKPKVTCGVGLALAKLEAIVQEEAEAHFGRKVTRIKHMGTYNCREMANYPGWVSEHSYANAIDIKEFTLQGGGKVSVLDHYVKSDQEPKTKKAKFLRQVARRLYDERVFSVVLTPSFDRAHRNHFHLDLARYWVDGI